MDKKRNEIKTDEEEIVAAIKMVWVCIEIEMMRINVQGKHIANHKQSEKENEEKREWQQIRERNTK